MQYLRVYKSRSGGMVELHPLHGKDELYNNFEASQIIADHGHSVKLLPELSEFELEARQLWMWDVMGLKNPDVRIDGNLIGDVKTPNPDIEIKQSTISRCIHACAKQKVSVAILKLIDREYSIQDLKKGIIGSLQPDRNKSIKAVWIITKDKRLFKVVRDNVFDDSIYDELARL